MSVQCVNILYVYVLHDMAAYFQCCSWIWYWRRSKRPFCLC